MHVLELQSQVADIQNQATCNTELSSTDFFELLDRLNQLTKSLNRKEVRESAAS